MYPNSRFTLLLLSLLLAVCALLSVVSAQNERMWYVTPDRTSDSCVFSPCNTLNEIAAMQDEVFQSFTTVVFLPGTHELALSSLPDPNSPFLEIRDIRNLVLFGANDLVPGTEASAGIFCQDQVGFYFLNVSDLVIGNLTVENCGAIITDKQVEEMFVLHTQAFHSTGPGQKAAFLLANIRSLFISSCAVKNSSGYGLLAVNALADTFILSSMFLDNNQNTVFKEACQPPVLATDISSCHGGNALFLFADLLECPDEVETHSVLIQDTMFARGVSLVGGGLSANTITGTGLAVIFAQSSYGVLVTLDSVISSGNRAMFGANLYFVFYEAVDNSRVEIENSRSMYSNNMQTAFERQASSGGLHVDYGLPILSTYSQPVCGKNRAKTMQDIFHVFNSYFQYNNAYGGFNVYFYVRVQFESGPDFALRFLMEGVTISNNKGIIALSISESKSFDVQFPVQFILQYLTIESNGYIIPIRNVTDSVVDTLYSAVQFTSCKNVTISDSNFFRNEGTALSASQSNIQMSGLVNFTGNSGVDGGALALAGSYIYLVPEAYLYFADNFALRYGGAIVIREGNDLFINPCFFQVLDTNMEPFPRVLMYFERNYAQDAGSVLYGGTIDSCSLVARSVYTGFHSSDVFDAITRFGEHDDSTSLISSDSVDVCFCHESPDVCAQGFRYFSISVRPGSLVGVMVVTRGQRNGISPASVRATFMEPFANATLDDFQQLQEVGKTCTNLTYKIRTSSDVTTLLLQTGEFSSVGGLVFNITLLPCTLGFVLLDGACECDPFLVQQNITCNETTQTINRPPETWINASFDRNGEYTGLIVHYNCPNDFCLPVASDLDLTDPDSQCALSHAGVLCGGCREGYSVTLGSFECVQCSNNYISLIIVFFVAGLALVTFIFVFNFTFTVGTLSGIIFYANVIRANQAVFFPTGTFSVISVFIAWLNLDPGYHYCFYDGMDSYAKTWLNYVFPFYIFLIIGGVILISRYSTKVSKTLHNSVQVLAMLMVLSYTKLFRDVIITSFYPTAIRFPDDAIATVWTQDGNVDFLNGRHIALFLGALVLLVFLIIPYTLFLVLVPTKCVQARTDHRYLRWLNKFKPWVDAHHGQYKNTYRNWTGILLVVRVVLFLILSLNIKNDPGVTLLVIAIFMFALTSCAWVGGGVYNKTWQNVLEGSFFINLGILSVTMLYVLQVNGNTAIAINISGSIALVEFVGVLIYHSYLQLRKIEKLRDFLKSCKGRLAKAKRVEDKDEPPELKEEAGTAPPALPPSTTVISLTQLREPLLDTPSHSTH